MTDLATINSTKKVAKTCSCQLDVINMQETPYFKPKRKLLEGEEVTVLRRVQNYRGQFVKVRSADGLFFNIFKSDLIWE